MNTGFSITQSISKRKNIRKLILPNEDITSYHVRAKYPTERGKKLIVYEQASIYRTFTELDLYQLIQIRKELQQGSRITPIENQTLLSVFDS